MRYAGDFWLADGGTPSSDTILCLSVIECIFDKDGGFDEPACWLWPSTTDFARFSWLILSGAIARGTVLVTTLLCLGNPNFESAFGYRAGFY